MNTIRFAVLLFAILQVCQAQVPLIGSCPNPPTVQDFQIPDYLGLWYEYAKYPFIFELGGKCITAEYGARSADSITVTNTQSGMNTNKKQSITGYATVAGPGKLNVRFDGVPAFSSASSNYWVLGTDYENYSVVYSCTNVLGLLHTEVIWILTRERKPTDAVIQQAKNVITQNSLSLTPLKKTDQDNCPNN